MAQETLFWLQGMRVPGIVIDATVGAGGHSSLILDNFDVQSLVAIDADPRMLERARQRLSSSWPEVSFCHMWFDDYFQQKGIHADRILFDLGVSLFHLALPDGGFSFRHDGVLDMRLDTTGGGETAADFVNTRTEREIADVIYEYGEERCSRQIAHAIVARRKNARFSSTGDLAAVVAGAAAGKGRGGRSSNRKRHPATKTFQAMRIWVNDELGRIERAIPAAASALNPGGRLLAISFHSLEDRIVKHAFRKLVNPNSGSSTSGSTLPMVEKREVGRYRLLTKKPVVPSDDEVRSNRASRSAKLRVLECIGDEG